MTVQTGRFARVERLADDVHAAVAEFNDRLHHADIDPWTLMVATARLERDLETLLAILRGAR